MGKLEAKYQLRRKQPELLLSRHWEETTQFVKLRQSVSMPPAWLHFTIREFYWKYMEMSLCELSMWRHQRVKRSGGRVIFPTTSCLCYYSTILFLIKTKINFTSQDQNGVVVFHCICEIEIETSREWGFEVVKKDLVLLLFLRVRLIKESADRLLLQRED